MANGSGNGILASIGGFILGLPTGVQVATAVGLTFLAGWRIKDGVDDFRTLPARVGAVEQMDYQQQIELNEVKIQTHQLGDSITMVSQKLDRVICLQEAQAGRHGYEQCAR